MHSQLQLRESRHSLAEVRRRTLSESASAAGAFAELQGHLLLFSPFLLEGLLLLEPCLRASPSTKELSLDAVRNTLGRPPGTIDTFPARTSLFRDFGKEARTCSPRRTDK